MVREASGSGLRDFQDLAGIALGPPLLVFLLGRKTGCHPKTLSRTTIKGRSLEIVIDKN